ncbi:hypothetical protein A3G63_02270 [Candidatus Kaiserbacteria bacterium RIFCSPLOWO2_12_FULL_52_8]|uniref:Uncharacterized protein n=1 Tax=Candidatus Kaiserbacteria bacterium RIFCSPHIGHO2_01_FULL_53_31 TaxID=1798481 RepID=A0A1F6CHN8_9BACT|nr:MAG: hypothetical protein A2678_03660 [Candidatus Kaiserbacteria bacterium RIFCSPHIGHO2_01_FULL_53_31]OGG93895.1 MAG: hypothetical protein A3G63_02270 [Candidatus Kaiserbacteria bacterium RIFCSPLOWO2_12_FULL_52_8]
MKSPIVHLGFALLLCIVVLVGYRFWYSAIIAKNASVANLESNIALKNAAAERISIARTTLAELAVDEARVQKHFAQEANVVSFIGDLEGRGRTLGTTVTVSSVSMSGTGARAALNFALSINGTFDAVMRTVGAIEYAPYNISIPTLTFSEQAEDMWLAEMKLVVGAAPTTVPAASTTPAVIRH